MRDAVVSTTAARCEFIAFSFGKRSDDDWGSVLMPLVLAGPAGILLVLVAE
jgi:hypothetical protein